MFKKVIATCGASRGLILGPLLFLICLKDVIHASNFKSSFLQMDTIVFFQQHSRPKTDEPGSE